MTPLFITSGLGVAFGVSLWFAGLHHAGTVLLVAGGIIFVFSASRIAHIHYPDDADAIHVYAVVFGSLAGILFASLYLVSGGPLPMSLFRAL